MADAHEPMIGGSAAAADFALTASPGETASYIAELTAELADLARRSRLDVLAYLLDIAKLEAATAAQVGPSRRKKT